MQSPFIELGQSGVLKRVQPWGRNALELFEVLLAVRLTDVKCIYCSICCSSFEQSINISQVEGRVVHSNSDGCFSSCQVTRRRFGGNSGFSWNTKRVEAAPRGRSGSSPETPPPVLQRFPLSPLSFCSLLCTTTPKRTLPCAIGSGCGMEFTPGMPFCLYLPAAAATVPVLISRTKRCILNVCKTAAQLPRPPKRLILPCLYLLSGTCAVGTIQITFQSLRSNSN